MYVCGTTACTYECIHVCTYILHYLQLRTCTYAFTLNTHSQYIYIYIYIVKYIHTQTYDNTS